VVRITVVPPPDRREGHQRLGDQQPPAHAAGQRPGIGMRLVGELHGLQDLVGAPLRRRHPVHAGLQFQDLARREEGVDVQFLRHHADRRPRLARVPVDVDAPDPGGAGGLVDHAGQDVDQGRLAGAVRAEQAEHGAARDLQIDAVQRPFRPGLFVAGIDLFQVPDLDREVGCRKARGRGPAGREGEHGYLRVGFTAAFGRPGDGRGCERERLAYHPAPDRTSCRAFLGPSR